MNSFVDIGLAAAVGPKTMFSAPSSSSISLTDLKFLMRMWLIIAFPKRAKAYRYTVSEAGGKRNMTRPDDR